MSQRSASTDAAQWEKVHVTWWSCDSVTSIGADVKMEDMDSKDKVSVAMLEQAYQVLMRKDIKDSLTSFISNIPGQFVRSCD